MPPPDMSSALFFGGIGMEDTAVKLRKLNDLLAALGSAAVGFSGGADSSFLAAAAHRILGERAVAVTCCSPTLPAGMTKAEVRELSRQWGLPTWNKPAAACLSSRVAYGQPVTAVKLAQIEQAEAVLRKYCRGQLRVRHHGDLARIEAEPGEIAGIAAAAAEIATRLKSLGFVFVSLDLEGYRTGSMNQSLKK